MIKKEMSIATAAKSYTPDFSHVKLFDEETGKDRDWVLFNCRNCGSKRSVHALAYYKMNKKKAKAKLQIDENNFHCMACGMESEPETQSPFMKRQIESWKKEKEKIHRFPDEQYVNLVNTLKSRSPEGTEIFNSFIHNDGSEKAKRFVNLIRNSKLYKTYPRSMTDDDRLFLAWFAYASTIDVKILHDEEKSMQEFERMTREE